LRLHLKIVSPPPKKKQKYRRKIVYWDISVYICVVARSCLNVGYAIKRGGICLFIFQNISEIRFYIRPLVSFVGWFKNFQNINASEVYIVATNNTSCCESCRITHHYLWNYINLSGE
jgi:hypothetical protein